MIKFGVLPTPFTLQNALLNMYLQLWCFAAFISATSPFHAYGKPLHGQITGSGLESSVFIGNAHDLIYFENGDSESAEAVSSIILMEDVILWFYGFIIEWLMGRVQLDCWFKCVITGYKIDSFVFRGALSACADLAMPKQGEMVNSQAIKSGYEVEMSVCGSLIDMYARNRNLQAAKSIFSLGFYPDFKCWNATLGA
ncbi:hypothetical protein F3Y22_tig00012493pilonHSYRG00042 [Hibiscus syriacus]|uniref:Pentatricopeptide repeat-containing protein n=1 Tax=Hibiscus syriacus TaxID=106335 RepID=A0A6A3C2F2_HIBSY|nr:hypothetical protein F3Y22_tig00012493pilonHSYRG00042 [Hibiscus syriacus]